MVTRPVPPMSSDQGARAAKTPSGSCSKSSQKCRPGLGPQPRRPVAPAVPTPEPAPAPPFPPAPLAPPEPPTLLPPAEPLEPADPLLPPGLATPPEPAGLDSVPPAEPLEPPRPSVLGFGGLSVLPPSPPRPAPASGWLSRPEPDAPASSPAPPFSAVPPAPGSPAPPLLLPPPPAPAKNGFGSPSGPELADSSRSRNGAHAWKASTAKQARNVQAWSLSQLEPDLFLRTRLSFTCA